MLPITAEILDDARALLDVHSGLSACDALHAAVVRHHGLGSICSYDRDFEEIEGLERTEPS